MSLHPCPACARHIKIRETACPFCGACVTPREESIAPAVRVAGRAAIVFATAAAITGTACGKKDAPPTPPAADASDMTSSGTVVAVYGPPPQWDELNEAAVPVPPPKPRDGGSG